MLLSSEELRHVTQQLREQLAETQSQLQLSYQHHSKPRQLLRGRTRTIDATLKNLWQKFGLQQHIALLAVGGYGRGELYPGSDIDLLILLPDHTEVVPRAELEQLIGLLWDIGLEVGHSVRTQEECLQGALNDISIETSLLEARYLSGPRHLTQSLQTALNNQLNIVAFADAKQAEQALRYSRFNDTPYALEPNCKESPGGLRDLQIIVWIARASHLLDTVPKTNNVWTQLAHLGIVTEEEARALARSERFLQQVRIQLHLLANRREDRLLFDLQEALAQRLGLSATKTRRASELMMQRYYLHAKKITQLNTIVLQNLTQRIHGATIGKRRALTKHFFAQDNLLDLAHEEDFQRHPVLILESFLLLQQNPDLRGMSAGTLRALWHARHLIDAKFRQNPEHRALFLKILQQDNGIVTEFRRMNKYGILGRYIPAFGRIVGQMQHDLFHVYTVDQHILQVLRNARRFTLEMHAHEYPKLSALAMSFERYWLIYIAALFHDIAKGRGGDHSLLGMNDAGRFCRDHGLMKEDIQLVVWLVQHHLTMSHTAQKKDISDPKVVQEFAQIVGTERTLNALYLLTHADIRGTSPKVWNAWRARLLDDLYEATRAWLRGSNAPLAQGLDERLQHAHEQLRFFGLQAGAEAELWRQLDTAYFMRHSGDEIAWHTRMLYAYTRSPQPIVKARTYKIEKGLQVMIYTPDERDLFMRLCAYFSRLGLSIVDAKIHTTRHGYALDSFILLDPNDNRSRIDYRDMLALIEHQIKEMLSQGTPVAGPPTGRLSRQLKHFPLKPEVSISLDENSQHAILAVTAADRPGLLYNVAQVLATHGFNLHSAKIATLGERAEDTFLISKSPSLHNQAMLQLEADLLTKLNTI